MEYEYVDESSIDENLKYSICNEPFKEPVTTICDHSFCKECIGKWIDTNKSCPTCRSRISNVKQLIPVKTRLILNMLDGLSIQCKTCSQTGLQRGNFKDHLKKCRKRNVCSCSAADIRCSWTGPKNELSRHLDQCPYEQIRPTLTEILDENRQLKQRINEINERYAQESRTRPKSRSNEELQMDNQRLEEQLTHLNQSYQRLKNELEFSIGKTNSSSNERNVQSLSTARTITFESLLKTDRFGYIPNGFAELNWINTRYTNEENARAIRPLKSRERISLFLRGYSCVIYNDWKNPIEIISSTGQYFTFHACEIMSVHHTEEICKLNIVGRRDQIPIYTRTVSLRRDISKTIELNSWMNINQIELSSEKIYFILSWIQLK